LAMLISPMYHLIGLRAAWKNTQFLVCREVQ
jgi:hypothetical protein